MFRRMIPLAVVIVILVGCKRKSKDSSDDGKVDGDPNATYTLKIRDDQSGDKTEESETETGTKEISFAGKSEKGKEERRVEFSEHLIEVPTGGGKPTKLTRTYKTAQTYDNKANAMKAAKYEGKTVHIEKKGKAYEFTVDGKKLDFGDSLELMQEFSKTTKGKMEDLLPKKAVKVGETWTVDIAAVKTLMGEIPFPIDESKSKLNGKLTRAYTKDGKQWGVINWDIDLVIDSASAAPAKGRKAASANGNLKTEMSLDAVIDGSARDGTMKSKNSINLTSKEALGEFKMVAEMTGEKTIRVAK